MQCDATKLKLSEWLDGMLSPEEADQVQAHLATCGDCRAEFESLRDAISALKQAPIPAPPGDLFERISDAVDQAARTDRAPMDRPPSAWNRIVFPQLRAVAAILLLGACCVYVVRQQLQDASTGKLAAELNAPSDSRDKSTAGLSPEPAVNTDPIPAEVDVVEKPAAPLPAQAPLPRAPGVALETLQPMPVPAGQPSELPARDRGVPEDGEGSADKLLTVAPARASAGGRTERFGKETADESGRRAEMPDAVAVVSPRSEIVPTRDISRMVKEEDSATATGGKGIARKDESYSAQPVVVEAETREVNGSFGAAAPAELVSRDTRVQQEILSKQRLEEFSFEGIALTVETDDPQKLLEYLKPYQDDAPVQFEAAAVGKASQGASRLRQSKSAGNARGRTLVVSLPVDRAEAILARVGRLGRVVRRVPAARTAPPDCNGTLTVLADTETQRRSFLKATITILLAPAKAPVTSGDTR